MINDSNTYTTSNGFRAVCVWGKAVRHAHDLISLVDNVVVGEHDLALIEVNIITDLERNTSKVVFLCEGMSAYNAARFIFGSGFAHAHRDELNEMCELDIPSNEYGFVREFMRWASDNAPENTYLGLWEVHNNASNMFFKAWDALA